MIPPAQSRRRAATITLIGGYLNIGLVAISGFILIPLYLQYIGARLYGAWAGSGDLIGWLGVLEMGVSSLSTQRIADAYGKQENQAVGRYYATGLNDSMTS